MDAADGGGGGGATAAIGVEVGGRVEGRGVAESLDDEATLDDTTAVYDTGRDEREGEESL